jgi:two-component system OmpR family response regulator
MRVLLVEDDRMVGAAIEQALKDAAYAVDWVRSGETAIQAAASESYDAVLHDYLVKPFEMRELLARMRAVLRRQGSGSSPVLSNGKISLDPATREASCLGETYLLTAREFALLQALLIRPGAILSRGDLEGHIYGWNEEVESNAIEFLIHNIRKKLGAWAIRNVRGAGWMVDGAS